MIAIFIITGLVAAFSLYDYFSSKSWQQVTSSDRNAIVFENRNHEYGAYQIRTDYNKRLIWIVLAVTLLIGAAFTTYKIVQGIEEPIKEEASVDLTAFAPDAEEEEEIVEPLDQEIPPAQQTFQFIAPVIDNDATEEEVQIPDPTVAVSTETQEGNDAFGEVVKDEGEPTQTEKPKEPEVFEYVEEFAEFPGGPAALKKYLGENIIYPPTAVELGVQGTVYVRFIVSERGNISNVRVTKGIPDCDECSEEAIRVFKSMPDWRPAKNNGKNVNSYFNSKVTFKTQ
ncbi:MAG: TonB family protein [Fluviicola sp.]|nr:TonB family protein [Fluviicola sp.]MBP6272800.1 TonB family protein [Fluviicola sp.]